MENELDKEMFDQISSLPIALIRNITLREKCPYSEFFWSECGSMGTRKTTYTDTFHGVL